MPIDFIPDDDFVGCDGCGLSGSRLQKLKKRVKGKLTKAVRRHVKSRSAKKHIAGIVRGARRMGVEIDDPEVMGTWIQDVAKKIKKAVKKTKSVQFTTDKGTAQLGPAGVTWTDKQAEEAAASPSVVESSASGITDMLKNPLVIGGLSLAALFLLKKKKGGKR